MRANKNWTAGRIWPMDRSLDTFVEVKHQLKVTLFESPVASVCRRVLDFTIEPCWRSPGAMGNKGAYRFY